MPSINNSHLYNEDCLLTRPERVIITEGVTDCIALMEHGFPAISPVTVQIRSSDWVRLLPKLRGASRPSTFARTTKSPKWGMNGALKTASVLIKHEIQTRIVILPLDQSRQDARTELKERFNLDAAVGPREISKLLGDRVPEEIEEAERLLAAAKIDVNDYFASGRTAQDFETLLSGACTPLEHRIDRLSTDVGEEERSRLLEPILREISALTPLEQSRHLKRVQEHFGKSSFSLTILREQVRAVRKERNSQARLEDRREKIREKRQTGAPSGSCRARVEQVLMQTEEAGTPDYTQAAEAAYDWFTAHGAQFFFTYHGAPFLYFDNAIYWMDSADRDRKRQYSAMLYKHTGHGADLTGRPHLLRGSAEPRPDPGTDARPLLMAPHRRLEPHGLLQPQQRAARDRQDYARRRRALEKRRQRRQHPPRGLAEDETTPVPG